MSEPQISCEEAIERLFDYLDSELDAYNRAMIEKHLNRCHDCFSRAEFEQRLRERLTKAASQQAPERLRQRIRAILQSA